LSTSPYDEGWLVPSPFSEGILFTGLTGLELKKGRLLSSISQAEFQKARDYGRSREPLPA